ncbi:MAG: acylphosphatase, partial [Bryobacteraceae bacterium]|nr:acylphosphatase [Bryobacteraceae bacterium]
MDKNSAVARRWFVEGRVQGVGFRWFVQKHARA